MSASALPQELIDRIIDIAKDDLQSLEALALVGPQWTWRTRKHLFQKIELREISSHLLDPTTRCKLLELLKVNSGLCMHARSLVIHSSTANPHAEETGGNLGWLQVCSEEVIRVIEMLQGVTAVSLLKGEREMNFSHLSSPLSAALKLRVFWGCLDKTLSRQAFSHFIHVTVLMNLGTFCRFNQSIEELDALKNGMLSYMPNLGGQSKVEIVFHLPS